MTCRPKISIRKTPIEIHKEVAKKLMLICLSIDNLKSLDSHHWAVKKAFADLHRPLQDFYWLSRINLLVKLRHRAIDSKNFPRIPSSPSGWRWKLRQVFPQLTSGVLFSQAHPKIFRKTWNWNHRLPTATDDVSVATNYHLTLSE